MAQACTEPASASQEPQEQPLMQSGDDSDVVYVNERQRDRILKRREQRAKQDAKLQQASGVRKPYLHESRHRHALNRVRGPAGRFEKKTGGQAAPRAASSEGAG